MEVQAKARYIRMSPRKVRLVVDLVRGLGVAQALAQLRYLQKAAARPVAKLIESAVANAKHNHQLDEAKLYVKAITADGGPTIKRWRSRAFGRAAPIRKRSTHISVTLAERDVEVAKGLGTALLAKTAAKPSAKAKSEAKVASGKGEAKAKSSAKAGGKKVAAKASSSKAAAESSKAAKK